MLAVARGLLFPVSARLLFLVSNLEATRGETEDELHSEKGKWFSLSLLLKTISFFL